MNPKYFPQVLFVGIFSFIYLAFAILSVTVFAWWSLIWVIPASMLYLLASALIMKDMEEIE